jgi:CheY-like chemotaxis protein
MISSASITNALQELTRCEPDLIVVQLHMQDENCFDFFKVARDIVVERDIPMIAVSAIDACDESIESYLKRCCQYFGCREYVANDDFRSNAFVHQLSRHFQVTNARNLVAV